MKVVYKYNNVDLKTYGVSVARGKGFLGVPQRKKPKVYEYPEHNGYAVDLSVPVYEARKITLDCFITANSAIQLASMYNAFTKAMLNVTDTVPFGVFINNSQVFSGKVFTESVSELNKTFEHGKNVGTFTLTIIEPEPTI